MLPLQGDLARGTIDAFLADLQAAVPRLLAGLLFLLVAWVLVKLVLTVLRAVLERTPVFESPVYRQAVVTVVGIFLWFGVLLGFLATVGLPSIAASLGTATGFVALGVSYAASEPIADAVAGVYLLRDPDFMPGDRVTVGDMTGVVRAIELRKTRFGVDGDLVVRGNAEVERHWRKLDGDDESAGDGNDWGDGDVDRDANGDVADEDTADS